jgi:hypothetical protein
MMFNGVATGVQTSSWNELFPAAFSSARSCLATTNDAREPESSHMRNQRFIYLSDTWASYRTTWTIESPATHPSLIFSGATVFDSTLNAVASGAKAARSISLDRVQKSYRDWILKS